MKEFYEEVYAMYFTSMSIREIALEVGIDIEEVKDIISLMAGGQGE